jgi:hypothetical protein
MPGGGMYHVLQNLYMVTPCILNNYDDYDESGGWIGTVQDRAQRRAFANAIRKISVP